MNDIIDLQEYFKDHPDEEEEFYDEMYYYNLAAVNDMMDRMEYA